MPVKCGVFSTSTQVASVAFMCRVKDIALVIYAESPNDRNKKAASPEQADHSMRIELRYYPLAQVIYYISTQDREADYCAILEAMCDAEAIDALD